MFFFEEFIICERLADALYIERPQLSQLRYNLKDQKTGPWLTFEEHNERKQANP